MRLDKEGPFGLIGYTVPNAMSQRNSVVSTTCILYEGDLSTV